MFFQLPEDFFSVKKVIFCLQFGSTFLLAGHELMGAISHIMDKLFTLASRSCQYITITDGLRCNIGCQK